MRTRIALITAVTAATIIMTTSITTAGADLNGSGSPITRARPTAARSPSSSVTARTGEIAAGEPGTRLAGSLASTLPRLPGSNALRWVEASAAVASAATQGTPAAATPATTTTPGGSPVAIAAPVAPPITDATSTATADWQCIRVHESGDVYNDPARPSGAYGILIGTWRSFGLDGWPYQASAAAQDHLALALYSEFGWQPWSTRFACGLG